MAAICVSHLCLLNFVDFIFAMYLTWLPHSILSLTWRSRGPASLIYTTVVPKPELPSTSYLFTAQCRGLARNETQLVFWLMLEPTFCLLLFSGPFLIAWILDLYVFLQPRVKPSFVWLWFTLRYSLEACSILLAGYGLHISASAAHSNCVVRLQSKARFYICLH